VYSLFGGKQELLNAVYVEGFNRLGARLSQVPQTDDPVEDIVHLGLAYRQSAITDPQFYLIMFSRSIPNFTPSESTVQIANQTFAVVVSYVRRAIDLAAFAPYPSKEAAAADIATSLWGLAHGLVSLELAGPLPKGIRSADLYERAIRAQTAGWRHPPTEMSDTMAMHFAAKTTFTALDQGP
jgi:AcrR family transcriptional regulator